MTDAAAQSPNSDAPALEAKDGASVSVSFYFDREPRDLPTFLVGRRGKSANVAAYGFKLFTVEPDWKKRSSEIDSFLASVLIDLRQFGVSPAWLAERDCTLRVYISLYAGPQYGDIALPNSTLALCCRDRCKLASGCDLVKALPDAVVRLSRAGAKADWLMGRAETYRVLADKVRRRECSC